MGKSSRRRSGRDGVINLDGVEEVDERTAKEGVRLHMRLGYEYAVIKDLGTCTA